MSWSWPHFLEFEEGPATVQSETFPDRDSAVAYAVEHHGGWDAIDAQTTRIVPVVDPAEGIML